MKKIFGVGVGAKNELPNMRLLGSARESGTWEFSSIISNTSIHHTSRRSSCNKGSRNSWSNHIHFRSKGSRIRLQDIHILHRSIRIRMSWIPSSPCRRQLPIVEVRQRRHCFVVGTAHFVPEGCSEEPRTRTKGRPGKQTWIERKIDSQLLPDTITNPLRGDTHSFQSKHFAEVCKLCCTALYWGHR